MSYDDDDENLIECSTCQCANHPEEEFCGYCGERLSNTPHRVYVEKTFNSEHTKIINQAVEFLASYEDEGYKASLRQLYYRFVSSVPGFANTEASYKRLGGIINNAKLAGLIDFDSMEDRGRSCTIPWSQPVVEDAMKDLPYSYGEDFWEDQEAYVEVWVEKDALSNVIERPCEALRVPYMACKGYMSGSATWEAGGRFENAVARGKRPVLIHLGDHDPSGIDMTRDNGSRLSMFAGADVEVRRIGLNMDQIEQYNPPPNPTKVTDSRAEDYIRQFGHTCWELDALSPSVIAKLIEKEIKKFIDPDIWNETIERQRENRAFLTKVERNADRVFDFVRGLD